jgi:hypothetical protein
MLTSLAAAIPALVRRPIKHACRSFGIGTSSMRCLPDFLIIGTHRAGTTSLHAALEQHPCVLRNFPRVQNIKGVRYFDEHYYRGPAWYVSHFPTVAYRNALQRLRRSPVLVGEASPYYLFHPLAAERASALLPSARLIVLLRNPIERAHSHWRRERRDGREPLPTFEEALAAESQRLAGEEERIRRDARYYSYPHENWSYQSQGLYLAALQRWFDLFPREQVFIESSERFKRDPQGIYERVLGFLGLPPFRLRNTRPLNVDPSDSTLPEHTRAALMDQFAPHNHRLEQCLAMKFGWEANAPGTDHHDTHS